MNQCFCPTEILTSQKHFTQAAIDLHGEFAIPLELIQCWWICHQHLRNLTPSLSLPPICRGTHPDQGWYPSLSRFQKRLIIAALSANLTSRVSESKHQHYTSAFMDFLSQEDKFVTARYSRRRMAQKRGDDTLLEQFHFWVGWANIEADIGTSSRRDWQIVSTKSYALVLSKVDGWNGAE